MTDTTTDIAVMAQQALAAATTPEAIKPIIEKQIAATVRSAVEDATRSFSPFGKELESKVKDALALNSLDLPSYNMMVCAMVQKAVDQSVSEMINGRLKKDIAELLSIAPKTIKLSEIVKWMTDRHEGEGYGEVVTCEVREGERYSDSDMWGPNWKVYLDEDNHYSHYEAEKMADIEIGIDHGIKEDRTQPKHLITTGTINRISVHGRSLVDSKGHFSASRPYGFERKLLALYAAETVIEVDEDECVISVGDY